MVVLGVKSTGRHFDTREYAYKFRSWPQTYPPWPHRLGWDIRAISAQTTIPCIAFNYSKMPHGVGGCIFLHAGVHISDRSDPHFISQQRLDRYGRSLIYVICRIQDVFAGWDMYALQHNIPCTYACLVGVCMIYSSSLHMFRQMGSV